jgi:hypothetical protein
MAALDDRPRPGREPTITLEARAWLVSLACRRAKDLGYPHELSTTRLLARPARDDDCNDMHCSRNGAPINCCTGNRHGDNDRQKRVAALPSQKAPFLVGSWQCP